MIVALLTGLAGIPLFCGGGVGLMMGEGPLPDGRIGQPPWQLPFGLLSLTASICSIIVVGTVWVGGLRKNEKDLNAALRLSAALPLAAAALASPSLVGALQRGDWPGTALPTLAIFSLLILSAYLMGLGNPG